jgi:two-component system alkaline phosphatase synthesis response regulator PhoP
MFKKILLVDDEPNIVMTLDFLLRKNKFEVLLATNGEEALQIAHDNIPDLIILDIMMPKVDGYQVCTAIRKSPAHLNTKIMFLSAKGKNEDIEKGLAIGANAYFQKPFSTRDLLKKIQELLAN